jgi:hypothetical protein
LNTTWRSGDILSGEPADVQARFRAQLTTLPDDIEVLSLREGSWASHETGRDDFEILHELAKNH